MDNPRKFYNSKKSGGQNYNSRPNYNQSQKQKSYNDEEDWFYKDDQISYPSQNNPKTSNIKNSKQEYSSNQKPIQPIQRQFEGRRFENKNAQNRIASSEIIEKLKKTLLESIKNNEISKFENDLSELRVENFKNYDFKSLADLIEIGLKLPQQDKNQFLLACDNSLIFRQSLLTRYRDSIQEFKLIDKADKVMEGAHIFGTFIRFFNDLIQTVPSSSVHLDTKVVEIIARFFANQCKDRHFMLCLTSAEIVKKQTLENLLISAEKLSQSKQILDDRYAVKPSSSNTGSHSSNIDEKVEQDDEKVPTGDFRDLNIYPTMEDILDQNVEIRRIRPNKPYNNLEQYLDINFRLLREDFYIPLRKGIEEFKKTKQFRKNDYLRFSKAQINSFIVTSHFVGLDICVFCPSNQIFFLNKNRFMHGSLILLSKDEFDSFIVCVVANKDEKDFLKTKKNGYFKIQAEVICQGGQTFPMIQEFSTDSFLMVETKVFFEGFSHVLMRLKQIETFPLENVIVRCLENYNRVPQYLTLFGGIAQMNDPIRLTVHPYIDYQIQKWINDPSHTLDESQKKSIQLAFQKNVSLIQGPPGTGKTFVGVHIARILLQLKQHHRGPILLICYTNHALDQFLEHLCPYTDKITRIGGRCKNEAFEKFKIVNKRKNIKKFNTKINAKVRSKHRLIEKYEEELKSSGGLNFLPFLNDFIGLTELEKDFFEIIRYKYQYDEYLKKKDLYDNSNPIYSVWNQFVNHYFKGITDLGMSILFWLEILTWDSFMKKMKEFHQQKELIKNIDSEDEEYLEMRAEKEIQKNNERNQNEEGLNEKTFAKINKFEIINFLFSKPFSFLNQKVENNIELIHSMNSKYQSTPQKLWGIENKIAIFRNQETINPSNNRDTINANLKLTHEEKCIYHKSILFRKNRAFNRISEIIEELVSINKEIKLLQDAEDMSLIRNDDFVAATTTGAAKNKNLLEGLNAKIIIVEEAAEVLETHVTSSLTEFTQQLVLIGDHMQLRPSVNEMMLSNDYHLDISMFERLINNKIESVQILQQRRMRPEISSLIRLLYPNLIDHESVKSRPSIIPFQKNVFFFNHQWREDETIDKESKKNIKEAEFICKFTEFLVKNNHKTSDITILSLYSGQLLHIKKSILKNQLIKDVEVVTVDDYQGRENKIILLSLVRSNPGNKIGFLKITNRVNVALSRAKDGLFIFGDALCIRNHETRIHKKNLENSFWLKVLTHLSSNQMIDDFLSFSCPRHKIETKIYNSEDFKNCPEGGCKLTCGIRRDCGHMCNYFCHEIEITNISPDGHAKFRCSRPCSKDHGCEHICPNSCSKCDPISYQCDFKVEFSFSKCKHIIKADCFQVKNEPHNIKCNVSCEKQLSCGHNCKRLCSESCTSLKPRQIEKGFLFSCEENVDRILNCGHSQSMPCGLGEYAIKQIDCRSDCGKALKCGHNCKMKCIECSELSKKTLKEIHAGDCNEKCEKPLVCDHICKDKCSEIKFCSPCPEDCKVKCSHSYCPKNCGEVCTDCVESCEYQCKHFICTRKCFELCNRDPCNESCQKTLKCGHLCIGFCGEICPKVCRICDPKNEGFEIFFGDEDETDSKFVQLDCGHVFESRGLDRWMHEAKKDIVKYPECPRCKSQIRFCMRYQEIIKKRTQAINKAKTKILDACKIFWNELQKMREILERKFIKSFENKPDVKKFVIQWNANIEKCKLLKKDIEVLLFSSEILLMYFQILENALKKKLNESIFEITYKFRSLLSKKSINESMRNLIIDSCSAIELYVDLLEISKGIEEFEKSNLENKLKELSIDVDTKREIKFYKETLEKSDFIVNGEILDKISKLLKKGNLDLFLKQKEKLLVQEIVKIMQRDNPSLGSGHWYQCPNGHVYAIGDCGGAMQTSKCPDCGATIGGQQHALASGNNHAGWADNSQAPAYPM
jgi:hypothetical protein